MVNRYFLSSGLHTAQNSEYSWINISTTKIDSEMNSF